MKCQSLVAIFRLCEVMTTCKALRLLLPCQSRLRVWKTLPKNRKLAKSRKLLRDLVPCWRVMRDPWQSRKRMLPCLKKCMPYCLNCWHGDKVARMRCADSIRWSLIWQSSRMMSRALLKIKHYRMYFVANARCILTFWQRRLTKHWQIRH